MWSKAMSAGAFCPAPLQGTQAPSLVAVAADELRDICSTPVHPERPLSTTKFAGAQAIVLYVISVGTRARRGVSVLRQAPTVHILHADTCVTYWIAAFLNSTVYGMQSIVFIRLAFPFEYKNSAFPEGNIALVGIAVSQ